MSEARKILDMDPREAPACNICGARNIDTRKIRIGAARDGIYIASFQVCRSCLKKMALDICAAYFDFSDPEPARTPEKKPEQQPEPKK